MGCGVEDSNHKSIEEIDQGSTIDMLGCNGGFGFLYDSRSDPELTEWTGLNLNLFIRAGARQVAG